MRHNSPLENIRVIMIDDDRTTTRLVKGVLTAFGFRLIDSFYNTKEAQERLNVVSYDIIICDWVMGEPNGIEVVEKIRKDKKSPNRYTPVIMISGRTSKAEVSKARDAGITEYMTKPFSVKALQSHIISVIEHPRNFIISRNYCGPDRRRKNLGVPEGVGEERRKSTPNISSKY